MQAYLVGVFPSFLSLSTLTSRYLVILALSLLSLSGFPVLTIFHTDIGDISHGCKVMSTFSILPILKQLPMSYRLKYSKRFPDSFTGTLKPGARTEMPCEGIFQALSHQMSSILSHAA